MKQAGFTTRATLNLAPNGSKFLDPDDTTVAVSSLPLQPLLRLSHPPNKCSRGEGGWGSSWLKVLIKSDAQLSSPFSHLHSKITSSSVRNPDPCRSLLWLGWGGSSRVGEQERVRGWIWSDTLSSDSLPGTLHSGSPCSDRVPAGIQQEVPGIFRELLVLF